MKKGTISLIEIQDLEESLKYLEWLSEAIMLHGDAKSLALAIVELRSIEVFDRAIGRVTTEQTTAELRFLRSYIKYPETFKKNKDTFIKPEKLEIFVRNAGIRFQYQVYRASGYDQLSAFEKLENTFKTSKGGYLSESGLRKIIYDKKYSQLTGYDFFD